MHPLRLRTLDDFRDAVALYRHARSKGRTIRRTLVCLFAAVCILEACAALRGLSTPTLILKGSCDYLSWHSAIVYRDLLPKRDTGVRARAPATTSPRTLPA